MPLTFIDIERQKNWRIGVFFLVLMALYFCIAILFAAIFLPVPGHPAPRYLLFAGVLALMITGIHFWFSAYDTAHAVVRGLGGQPPDRGDDVHAMLLNIMAEMHVVTGNRRRIECVVIPSLSLNALAVADLKGHAVIGITEGLLSRLSRPQLESVIAHEAHHILSGDCLEATVATSLFGTYAAAIEKLQEGSRGRSFSSPAFLLTWSLLQLSYLLNLFISREREYRADAASVRMTRNPLALAETLHLLSRSWRGAGFIGSGFEMLCIVNPKTMALDETEGFFADLLSTHPPIAKRIDILLKMARVSVAELDERADRKAKPAPESDSAAVPRYYAMSPKQEWQGPFSITELAGLPWLSPLTWVTTGDNQPVDRAWTQQDIGAMLTARLREKERILSDQVCPACKQPLVMANYEGTTLLQCSFCAGALVENEKIARIIARTGRERPCTQRITALARTAAAQNQMRSAAHARGGSPGVPLFACPKCRNSMWRGFYSSAHLIEVDRCTYCSLTWFDQDELAMLQCLIENRIVPGMPSESVQKPEPA